jgi:hypothetical protein
MSDDIKVLSTRRISHGRDTLGNMAMPIEVKKQADGSFKAHVRGQEAALSATGTTESNALFAVKQVIMTKLRSGDFNKVDQRMV